MKEIIKMLMSGNQEDAELAYELIIANENLLQEAKILKNLVGNTSYKHDMYFYQKFSIDLFSLYMSLANIDYKIEILSDIVIVSKLSKKLKEYGFAENNTL